MSTNWMLHEKVLDRAEARLLRRIEAQVWLIRFHNFYRHMPLKVGRAWTVDLLKKQNYPGWYDKTQLWLTYDDVSMLASEARTLVLRLRALKYHGSVYYLDPQYTKVTSVLDYKLPWKV